MGGIGIVCVCKLNPNLLYYDFGVNVCQPSLVPSSGPSDEPSHAPSGGPSTHPSVSWVPTVSTAPSMNPSMSQLPSSSSIPSDQPSLVPSQIPSDLPSLVPTTSALESCLYTSCVTNDDCCFEAPLCRIRDPTATVGGQCSSAPRKPKTKLSDEIGGSNRPNRGQSRRRRVVRG